MSTTVGRLKAQMDLSAPGLGTQISGIGSQFKNMRGELVSSVGQIHPALGTFTRALTGPAGIVAASNMAAIGVARAFKTMMTESEEIVSAANRLKMGTEFLERMRYVAERTGTSFGTVTSGFQRMQLEISRAQGGAGRADIFRQLGLDPESLRRMAPEQTFRDLARSITAIDNPIDRARVQYELFGRSGIELDAVLRRVAGGMDDIATVSEESRRRMSALQDRWIILKRNLSVGAKEATASLADLMGKFTTIPLLRMGGMKTDMQTIWALAEAQTKGAAAAEASAAAAMEEDRLLERRVNIVQRLRREIDLLREGADAIAMRDFIDAGAGIGEQADLQMLLDQRNELREAQRQEAVEAARIATIEQQRISAMRQLRDEVDRLRMGEEQWQLRLFEGEERMEAQRLFRERERLRGRTDDLPGAAVRGSREAYSAIVQSMRQSPQVELQRQGNRIAQGGFDRVEQAVREIAIEPAVAQAPFN